MEPVKLTRPICKIQTMCYNLTTILYLRRVASNKKIAREILKKGGFNRK